MIRGIAVVLSLSLSFAADAADADARAPSPPAKAAAKKPATDAVPKRAGAAAGSDASDPGAAGPRPSGTKASAGTTGRPSADRKDQRTSAARTAVRRAKSTFIFAVDSCERPDRCDQALRSDAEDAFVKACLTCAPAKRCEEDRQAIRDGKGKMSFQPCEAP